MAIQAAARRFLAGRRVAEAVARIAWHHGANLIQHASLRFLDRRRSAAVARLRVLLTEVSLGHTDILFPTAQRTSGPTGTEQLDTTGGSMRGRKAASSAARAKERRVQGSSLAMLTSGIAELKLRAGHAPVTARLGALLFPLIVPAEGFDATERNTLIASISQRMARIEMDSSSIAGTVLDAVTGELVYYDNLARSVHGFEAAEIVAESPAYFTGLARQLGVYLKKIEAQRELVHIPTNYPLGDDYFTFVDKINTAVAVTTKARSTTAMTLEAEVAAALQAEADQRGVTLGWLLRSTDGDDSDDADSQSET